MSSSYQSAAVMGRPFLNLDFVIFKFNLLTSFGGWADGSQMPARQQAVDVGRNFFRTANYQMNKVFLKAEWRKLAMVNYSVDKSILDKYLPHNTEIDLWYDTCYVSLVGFMFKDTKIKGLKIPFHTNFEEVNLRFYVRSNNNGTWKRGVVFIKEIVPKPALTLVANAIYKENYETMSMGHTWTDSGDSLTVEYKWRKKQWNSLKIRADKDLKIIESGSEEEFITEHYWGYTKITNSKTSEYGVEHPKWHVYPTRDYLINVDFEDSYGQDFSFLKTEKPKSVFLAEGSEIKVMDGKVI